VKQLLEETTDRSMVQKIDSGGKNVR
jgi:hypothetical protein